MRGTTVLMASKLPGSLAPGAVRAQRPARSTSRLCTGATSATIMDMMVIVDDLSGLEVSVAEADLYLHWASDLLDQTKDDDNGSGQAG